MQSKLILDETTAAKRMRLKPQDAYLFSFLIPLLIMILIFFVKEIFPFGEETFLRTDMYHQYAPFFSEFQYKLRHGGSLLYSWDVGLGVNFSALYAYYLASPLNWLIILCPKSLVLEFMTYMIVLKIALSGLTMAYYLRHHYRTYDFGCTYFAVFYAMSGYIAAYSWNIMWLDCIILFPLILYGMEKLMRGESGMLYSFTLGLSILSNYYISIMTCIFLVIYFICCLILRPVRNVRVFFKKAMRFAVFSLLAGGVAAATLLPEIAALKGTASGDFNFPTTVTQYFTIVDMFARHMPLVYTEQGLDHWPNFYCGAFVFLLLPAYAIHPQIPVKRKAVYFFLLIFFYLSFSINVLNFIWHGFHYPNSLPCRQSFIYVLLVLSMGYEAYIKRKGLNRKQGAFCLAAGMVAIILMQKLVTQDEIKWWTYYVTLLLLALYYMFFALDASRKTSMRFLTLGMTILITVESAANMMVTSVTTTSRTAYLRDNQDVHTLVNEVRSTDEGFYRFEKMSRKTKDDGAWMNFPSVSLFSSTAYAACSDFFKKIGCEASTNAYSITGSTPLVNMLFGVKYDIYSEEPEATGERGLDFVESSGDTLLYQTRFALPLGFMMTDKQLENWHIDMGTPALVQNSLADAMECNPVLLNVLGTYDGNSYEFTAQDAGEYYVYCNSKAIKEVRASFAARDLSFDNVDRGMFLELGWLQQGETVTLTSQTDGQNINCDVYRFDYNALSELYEKLAKETWSLDTWEDTHLKGRIQTEDGGVMLTSIPYDAGWTVFVDGQKVTTEKYLDTFIGIPMAAGTHTVELRYFPVGLRQGIVISGLSLILLLLLWHFSESKRKKAGKSYRRDDINALDKRIIKDRITTIRE